MSWPDLIGIMLALSVFGAFEARLTYAHSEQPLSWGNTVGYVILPTVLLLTGGATPPRVPLQFYQYLIFPVILLLTWKLLTRNYDYRRQVEPSRTLLLGVAATAGVADAALPALLSCVISFNVWTHHFLLPLRLIMAYTSCRIATGALGLYSTIDGTFPAVSGVWAIHVLMAVHLSHYVVPGIAKLTLGATPWTWIRSNRTQLLLPAAYVWGWRRLLPEWQVWAIGKVLAHVAPGLNAVAIALECGCLLAPASAPAYAAFCFAFIIFHLVIYLLSGICFWEYAAVNALLGLYFLLWFDPPGVAVFGPKALLVVGGIILLFPLRQVVWKPHRLAWWETPLLNRIRFEVIGRSGTPYGLYNNVMCPYDREFGRIPLRYCVDEPLLTGPLGQVESEELRDRIVATGGCPAALNALKQTHGEYCYDPVAVERFIAEMKGLFRSARKGHPRNPLPRRLRALKAPGGHHYYWGELPPFAWQEDAQTLRVYYIEEYLSENKRVTLGERMILSIDLN